MLQNSRMAATVAVLVGLLETGPARGQQPGTEGAPLVKSVEEFSGKTRLSGPQAQEVSVAIHRWSIGRRQKIAALKLPVSGTLIAQLRAGALVTTINGNRQKRRADEFWTVPAGVNMGVEIGNDTVILETIVISE